MVRPPAYQPISQITNWALWQREVLIHWKQVVHHADLAVSLVAELGSRRAGDQAPAVLRPSGLS